MADYVGALDQGTTSTRFMIFDHGGQVVGIDQKEHEQIYPEARLGRARSGSRSGRAAQRSSAARSRKDSIKRVGPRGRRHHQPARDGGRLGPKTGKPVYNAIVWQDTRTDQIVDEFAKDGGQDRLRAEGRAAAGDLLLGPQGQVDPRQRRWRPGQGRGRRPALRQHRHLVHLEPDRRRRTAASTSPTSRNASRTMLMDLETLDWDDEILEL